MTDNASGTDPKKAATWVSYLPAVGVVIVFVLGIAAGWFVASVPFRMQLKAQDRTRALGLLVKSYDKGAEIRAAAYLDPAKAKAELDSYIWVPRNVPAPGVGVISEPSDTITAPGFRGEAPPLEREPGLRRVILVGGSTAFSSGAPSLETTIGGYLQAELTKSSTTPVKVYTFANPAWASSHESIAVTQVLLKYQPDLVVALSGVNDCYWAFIGRNANWTRTQWGETHWWLNTYATKLAGREPPVDPTTSSKDPLPTGPAITRLLNNVDTAAHALKRQGADYIYALQPNIFTNVDKRTAREKALAAEVAQERHDYFNKIYAQLRSLMPKAADSTGFGFVDVSTMFDASGRTDEVFLDSYHFGDRGNQAIARKLAEAVQARLRTR